MLKTKFGKIPGHLKHRNGKWYYYLSLKGNEIRVCTHRKSEEQARTKAWRLYQTLRENPVIKKKLSVNRFTFAKGVTEWGNIVNACDQSRDRWLGNMHRRALDRSRRRNINLTLTYDQLKNIAIKSNGKCQVSGIPFSFDKQNGSRYAPYSPTLDRIDSHKGYSFRNCRLVCNCVNNAMGEWGEEVLFMMADAVGHVAAQTRAPLFHVKQ